MYVAGIDIGSTTTETVILQSNEKTGQKNIIGNSTMPTGYNHQETAETSLTLALENVNINRKDISFIVSTGYGRNNAMFADKKSTEIICHGQGAQFLFPNAQFIIDIGGQDCKVIKLSEHGKVIDFSMNEKCAAGTGRFIEVMARVLQVELDQMGELSLQKTKTISISNMCTVFAESEIISKISEGYKRENIIAGLHNAVVDRILPMGRRLGIKGNIILTGGVAKNKGIIAAFKEKLDADIFIPENPQIVGALGAAIIAHDEVITEGHNKC